jgi:hypothetical protein
MKNGATKADDRYEDEQISYCEQGDKCDVM